MHAFERWARMWGWKCETCKHPSNGRAIGSREPLNWNRAKRGATRHLKTLHPDDGAVAEDLIYRIGGD